MKLDQMLFAACVGVVALATGCSAVPAAKTASTDRVSDAVASTQLMSAHLGVPAQAAQGTPRVGKPHLAGDDDVTLGVGTDSTGAASDASGSDGESAPKAVRRSDGSRRHGGFGTTK